MMMMLQPLSTDLYLASLPSLATVFGVPRPTVQLTLIFAPVRLLGQPAVAP
jgi:hypothetical protein